MELFGLIGVVGAIFWIIAGVLSFMAGPKGIKVFVLQFIGVILLDFILWAAIYAPEIGCEGFLCGLGAFITVLLAIVGVSTVWGVIAFFVAKSNYDQHKDQKELNGCVDSVRDLDQEI